MKVYHGNNELYQLSTFFTLSSNYLRRINKNIENKFHR